MIKLARILNECPVINDIETAEVRYFNRMKVKVMMFMIQKLMKEHCRLKKLSNFLKKIVVSII